jgi:hypothetical protein
MNSDDKKSGWKAKLRLHGQVKRKREPSFEMYNALW